MNRLRTRVLVPVLAALTVATVVRADAPVLKTTALGRGPAVVFLPGLGMTRSQWMPTARKLVATHRVVLVDLPGQGESGLPDPFSFEACGEALRAVLAQHPAESTVVVGHGVGGIVALAALGEQPAAARGLLLIDTQIKSPIPVPDQQRQQLVQFMDANYETFTKMAFGRMGRDSVESAMLYTNIAQTAPATIKTYIRGLLGHDANRAARVLRERTEMVLSDRMWPTDRSAGATLQALGYEDTTLTAMRRVANAGYLVMKDQPDTLAALITAFTARRLAAAK